MAEEVRHGWNRECGFEDTIGMPKFFSKGADPYLDNWLKAKTWNSHHPLDMERFWQLLKALKRYQTYSKKSWLRGFREKLRKAVEHYHPGFSGDYYDQHISFFAQKAELIHEYETARGIPDPLVEVNNPYRMSAVLRSFVVLRNGEEHRMYTSEEAAKIVNDRFTEKFGKNWRERFR